MTVSIALPGRAVNYPLSIQQRSDFDAVFPIQDSDGTTLNLTGYSAQMQIRSHVESDTVLVELVDGDGITLGGVTGTVTLHLDGSETALYTWRRGRYDLYLFDSLARPRRVLEGDVIVYPTVTRD